MSIRIHNEALPGTSVSELSRAEEVSRSAKDGSKSISGAGITGGDQVELSSLSGSISQALTAAAAHQSGKVQHLAALYASGKYNVNSVDLGRAIVSQTIGSSSNSE
jgi:hypothetical protein